MRLHAQNVIQEDPIGVEICFSGLFSKAKNFVLIALMINLILNVIDVKVQSLESATVENTGIDLLT